ncbi:MAG: hypothetical protein ACM3MK_05645 [Chitinophagales bacterium]
MSQMHRFMDYCEAFKNLVVSPKETEELVVEGQTILGDMLSNPDFLLENLSAITESRQEEDYLPIDVNDITIYRDPDRLISIRLFIWQHNFPYPIHDHGSWGIFGCLTNQIQETKYRRKDEGTQEDYAELEIQSEAVLKPGDTSFVLPLDQGIHKMRSYGGKTALSVHVYGKPLRTGFIRGFLPSYNASYKMFPVKLHRRVLAIKALEAMGSDWAQEILRITARDENEIVREISREALDNIKGTK